MPQPGSFDVFKNGVLQSSTPIQMPDALFNQPAIIAKAQAALTANANLQAAPAPTVGSLAQAQSAVNTIWAAMQIQSKELTALVYLVLNQFDTTSGT